MLQEESRIQDVYEKRRNEKGRLYSWFSKGQLFWFQELERALLELLSDSGIDSLEDKAILDIGCGSGHWIREFVKLGATPENLAGIDLLDWRIDAARGTCPANVRLERGNADELRFSDQSFDLITQFTVFSSILDSNMKQKIASEMLRVLKEDGCIIWYDFFVRDPRNQDVRGITRKEILQLFPGCQVELRRVSLALPLVRMLAPYSWLLCYLLEKLKVLDTHYVGLIRRGPPRASILLP
ncbi:MAG: class I SAM-dependent methyltransferase [Nitrospira sp.]